LKLQCISNNTIPIEIIEKIVQYGKNCSKNQLFYCQVEENLSRFAREIQTRCSHKGDLWTKENYDSGLGHYFHHIEWCQTNKLITRIW
jgi:putative hydrolase of the HAD superfamily